MMLREYALIFLIVNGTTIVVECSSEENVERDVINTSSDSSLINQRCWCGKAQFDPSEPSKPSNKFNIYENKVCSKSIVSRDFEKNSRVTIHTNSTKTKTVSKEDSPNPSDIVAIKEKDDNEGKNHIKYMSSNINNTEGQHQVPYKSNNNRQDYQNRWNNNKIEKISDMPKRNIDQYGQIADTNCNLSKNPNYPKKLYYATKSHRLLNLNNPKQEMNMPTYNNNKLFHNFQDKSSQNYVAKCNPTYPKSHESNNYANASYPHIFPNLPVNGLFYNQYPFAQPNLMKSNAMQQNVNILSENIVYYETIEDFLYINFLQFFPLLRNNFDSALNMSSLYANINRVYPHLKLPDINFKHRIDINIHGFYFMQERNRIFDKELFSLYTFYDSTSVFLDVRTRSKIECLDELVRSTNSFVYKYELYLTLHGHFVKVFFSMKKP